jgi:hypothetical protein
MRVVLRNGVVLSLSGNSQMTLDEHVAGPAEDSFTSLTAVARGKLPTAPVRLDETIFRQYPRRPRVCRRRTAREPRPRPPAAERRDRVPEDDRAHVVLPEGLPAGGWSSLPGEPPYDKPDVSSLLGEPPAAVGDPGGLGVRF